MQHTAHYFTLGCKLNYAETSTYMRALEGVGIVTTHSVEEADLLVVNSCGVTQQAQRKCRQLLHRLRRLNPTACIVVLGCYVDLDRDAELQNHYADLVIPRERKGQLISIISERLGKGAAPLMDNAEYPQREGQFGCQSNYFPAYSVGGRTRSFLKVQDGCSYRCTYCAIPLARGESRSPSLESVVHQANLIAEAGAREVVITGVNTGDFGRGSEYDFAHLLLALAERTAIPRYRISSIEPNLLNTKVLQIMAQHSCFMPHLHVPLQSGSDTILRAMRRRYRAQQYRECIERAREALGDVFIGVDVIVGFPGESEQHFSETENLLRELRPAALHVFPFSAHPNTPAFIMPNQLSTEVKQARVQRLLTLSTALERDYRARFIGQERMMLVEHVDDDGVAEGFTDNYLRVKLQLPSAKRGEILPVRVL